MKEMEFRNYNRILADVPFGNYKFAKSPYVDISLSQIITKSDPGDVMRIHTLGSVQEGLESSVSSSAGLGATKRFLKSATGDSQIPKLLLVICQALAKESYCLLWFLAC